MEGQSEGKITLRDFFDINFWLIKLYLNLMPVLTVLRISTLIYRQIENLVTGFILALLIDRLISIATTPNSSISSLIPYLALVITFKILGIILRDISNYCGNLMQQRSDFEMRQQLYKKIRAIGVEKLEDPEVNNKLNRVNDHIYDFPYHFTHLVDLIARLSSALISGITLAGFFPILIPILILSSIPRMFVEKYYLEKNWKHYRDNTEERRKANSSIDYLNDSKTLKEILLTNSANFFDNYFSNFVKKYIDEIKRTYDKWYIYSGLITILSQILILFAYLSIFNNLLLGLITVGTLTFQMRVVDYFYGDFFWGIFDLFNLRQRTIRFQDNKTIFDLPESIEKGKTKIKRLENPPAINFQEVGFRYPNANNDVIQNLNLEIKPGEKIAIVGKNGAGKTTLVKLLSKFYNVTNGQIKIGDEDLHALEAESWYKNLSVLYQDYNTYEHLTVAENVYVGDPSKAKDDEKIKQAIDYADAEEFVDKYENKYDQILSERFKGGTRPSTGQWQKIALARFFYRQAPIIIFDEPTAAIDAESEYKIFNKIYNFFENKTVIIISHRFSTVRNADRIIVFDDGKIIEEGSHEQLLKKKGRYAKAFELQAKGYR